MARALLAGISLLSFSVSSSLAELQTLFPGVTLEIETRTDPRPLRLCWLEADLTVPGVNLVFTPPGPESIQPANAIAAKSSELLQRLGWQALMNGDAFFVVGNDGKKYPDAGDPLKLQGYGAYEGRIYGELSRNNGTFYLLKDRRTMGVTYDRPPRDTWGAVGGYRIVVRHGKVQDTDNTRKHPRSVIGGNNTTHRVYFLVVDGRQPGRSEGATERELGEWMRARGATEALSVDGGGSSVLLVEKDGGPWVVNRPVGVFDTPGTLRCIGSAVGLKIEKE